MQLSNIIKLTELLPYIIIGGIATLIDWGLFALLVTELKLHYQTALVVAYSTASIMHYISNKLVTFKCSSKQLGSQFSLFIIVALSSLALSMGVIAVLINVLAIQKITARILTTLIMLLPNYLLHKHITFSKKIFSKVEAN